jgi:hypothetical protein
VPTQIAGAGRSIFEQAVFGDFMKIIHIFAIAATLCLGFSSIGCETSHAEKDSPGLFGGNTHEETTTTHNPVTGTDDTTHTETKTP